MARLSFEVAVFQVHVKLGKPGIKSGTAAARFNAPAVAKLHVQVRDLERFYRSQIALVAQGVAGRERAQGNVFDGKARFDAFRARALLQARFQRTQ